MKHTHKQIIFQTRISWCPTLGHHSLGEYFLKLSRFAPKIAFPLLVFSFLSSCVSIKEFSIETMRPAEITYPAYTRKVVVVDNTVMQPADIGHTVSAFGNPAELCSMPTDSVMHNVTQTLSKVLEEQGYFRQVVIAKQPARSDASYYRDIKMSTKQVNALCSQSRADVVISIDKLLFNGKQVVTSESGYIVGLQRVDVTAIFRAYLPNRVNPLATILITDSVEWFEGALSIEQLTSLLPTANNALREAASVVSSKVYRNFVPHWTTEQRWYYTSEISKWKLASAFAAKGKWDEAKEHWLVIYSQAKSPIHLAKSATNLALACEMTDKLSEALKWITLSANHFERLDPIKNIENKSRTLLYKEAIENRILSDKKLNIQFDIK